MTHAHSYCDLDSTSENAWTLGQIMSVVMLLGLILPAFDVYSGKANIPRSRPRVKADF
jgi:hypothetical protein